MILLHFLKWQEHLGVREYLQSGPSPLFLPPLSPLSFLFPLCLCVSEPFPDHRGLTAAGFRLLLRLELNEFRFNCCADEMVPVMKQKQYQS